MGKISNALNKYAKERRDVQGQPPPPIALNQDDVNALLKYDHETKHLLRYDKTTGEVDQESIEVLRNQGTIQRLLDSKLIYPSGKLTPRGLKECRRLEAELGQRPIIRPTASGVQESTDPKVTDTAIENEVYSDDTEAAEESASLSSVVSSKPQPEALAPPKPSFEREITRVAEVPEDDMISVFDSEPDEPAAVPVTRKSVSPARPVRYNEKSIDPTLVSLHTPHSFEAEQFKILRTNILFPVAGKPPRSILVTSSNPGEGKTFTAANLAISIALNINKHVLLIDGDLRKPEQHRRFGFGKLPGLTDYLVGGTPLPSLLVKTKIEKLTLLPAGEPPDNPSELVSSEQMSSLLAEVTNRYSDRLIVIDSPPPSFAAETGVLARQVDGILLVVSYGKTRREDAVDVIETLGKEKMLGSLINYIDPKATRYYGYSQYGYYGKK